MAKIKLDDDLYNRAKKISDTAGYSSVDEFIAHVLEKEIRTLTGGGDYSAEDEEKIKERLKGLGYIS
jgi:predicted CopG family antitoxin